MIYNIISFLHIAPLLAIISLAILGKVYSNTKKNSSNYLAKILILSSVGIASGFGVHPHHLSEADHGTCYVCLGYAIVLAAAGIRLSYSHKLSSNKG